MQKIIKFLIPVFIFLALVVPAFSSAAFTFDSSKGLIPCTNTPNADGTISVADKCDFNAFMTLINNVIGFILFYMVIPIAAIMFFYAGFKMVTSGGSAESKTKAKEIFTNAVYGLVIAAGAWLIVKTILSILGYSGAWIGF